MGKIRPKTEKGEKISENIGLKNEKPKKDLHFFDLIMQTSKHLHAN